MIRVEARIIRVSVDGPLRSIRSAVNMARPGDTIFVGKGIYRSGNLIINKPLSLIGEGQPVLDGEQVHEIMTIRSNRVSVSGFTFIRAGKSSYNDIAALRIIEASDITVTHMRRNRSHVTDHLQDFGFQGQCCKNTKNSGSRQIMSILVPDPGMQRSIASEA